MESKLAVWSWLSSFYREFWKTNVGAQKVQQSRQNGGVSVRLSAGACLLWRRKAFLFIGKIATVSDRVENYPVRTVLLYVLVLCTSKYYYNTVVTMITTHYVHMYHGCIFRYYALFIYGSRLLSAAAVYVTVKYRQPVPRA